MGKFDRISEPANVGDSQSKSRYRPFHGLVSIYRFTHSSRTRYGLDAAALFEGLHLLAVQLFLYDIHAPAERSRALSNYDPTMFGLLSTNALIGQGSVYYNLMAKGLNTTIRNQYFGI